MNVAPLNKKSSCFFSVDVCHLAAKKKEWESSREKSKDPFEMVPYAGITNEIPGTDARAAGASREEVQRMCSGNLACKGYYGDDTPGKTWYLATDTDPAKCKVRGRETHPAFYQKTYRGR